MRCLHHLFTSCSLPGFRVALFHSVAGRPYSKNWSTFLDREKQENKGGTCGREHRGPGVISLGSVQGCHQLTLCLVHGIPHPKDSKPRGREEQALVFTAEGHMVVPLNCSVSLSHSPNPLRVSAPFSGKKRIMSPSWEEV